MNALKSTLLAGGLALAAFSPALADDVIVVDGNAVVAQAAPSPDDELIGEVGPNGEVIPADNVRVYIDENPGDTIVYRDTVTVGTVLPDDVEFREIPDYRYRYVRLNDRPVLVDPGTRRVVYVYQ